MSKFRRALSEEARRELKRMLLLAIVAAIAILLTAIWIKAKVAHQGAEPVAHEHQDGGYQNLDCIALHNGDRIFHGIQRHAAQHGIGADPDACGGQ